MIPHVYVDTNILIAAYETNGPSSRHAWSVFHACESGEFVAVTSEFTLTELLPKPMADGDARLLASYMELLIDRASFRIVPVSRDILVEAARLRVHNACLKLPDSVHRATASKWTCVAFLTEDLRLSLPPEIRRVTLSSATLDILRVCR